MNGLEEAIYALLSEDTDLAALAPGGVWRGTAPESAKGVVVTFTPNGGPDSNVQGGGARAFSELVYLVKAIGPGISAVDVGLAAAKADSILHGADLTLDSGEVLACLRTSSMSMDEPDGGELWRHVGGFYSIWATGA